VTSVVRKGRQVAAAVVSTVRDPMHALRWLGNFKRVLVLGASVGLAVATVSLLAPHLASAVVSGVASGVAAVAVQLSLWTRRAVHVLAMA
jgi:NaMN:DMB phosphoribosyltransferase